MPIPIVATIGIAAAKNPTVQKVAIGSLLAIPLVLIMLIMSLSAAFLGNSTTSGTAAQGVVEAACLSSAEGTQTQAGTTEYQATSGGDALMAFLHDKGLTWEQARIAWSLGMRESGGRVEAISNTGDYGLWQINQVHREFVEDKWGWSLLDLAQDANKNYTVMMHFSQRLKNPVAWGLAANQRPNSVTFDWSRYPQSWHDEHRQAAEDVYIKWYNQFPDAARKSGLSFRGTPAGAAPTAAPTAASAPTPAPAPAGTGRPSPGRTGVPTPSPTFTLPPLGDPFELIRKPSNPPVQGPGIPVVNDPFASLPSPVLRPAGQAGTTVQSRSAAMVIKAETVPAGALSISGFPVLNYGDPGLVTFRAGGRSWTVAKQFEPLFRGFLMDWAASPFLGQGRFPLSEGESGGHVVRRSALVPSQWSDHAAGTAVDIRYDIMPQRAFVRHMTDEETTAVRQLLNKYPQLAWGGDYSMKNMDEMHFYVRRGVPPASVQSVTAVTLIYTDGSTDRALSERGPLYDNLAGYPFETNNVTGRTIEQAIGDIRKNPKVTSEEGTVGAFVYALGTAEVKVGEDTVKENEALLAADPSAIPKPVELLDPDKVDRWIARAVGLAGIEPVIWIAPTAKGPSRDIFMDRLNLAKTGYTNLTVIQVPDSPALGYVTDNGDLTDDGEQWIADQVAQQIADAQPLYTEREECQELLFGAAATATGAVYSGDFQDRTDIIIPTGEQQRSNLYSWIGVTRAPCSGGPRCIGQCDHLAGKAAGSDFSGYRSAKSHWDLAVSTPSGRWGQTFPGDKSVPIGGLLFFDTGKVHGHVATYVGNGMVIHNTTGKYGPGVYEESADAVAARFKYLGWATPVFPGPQ